MTRKGGWPPSGFAERLKAIRGEARLSQGELAERAGVHYMTISELERGATEPAWPLVLALARALAVSITAFLPVEPTPEATPATSAAP